MIKGSFKDMSESFSSTCKAQKNRIDLFFRSGCKCKHKTLHILFPPPNKIRKQEEGPSLSRKKALGGISYILPPLPFVGKNEEEEEEADFFSCCGVAKSIYQKPFLLHCHRKKCLGQWISLPSFFFFFFLFPLRETAAERGGGKGPGVFPLPFCSVFPFAREFFLLFFSFCFSVLIIELVLHFFKRRGLGLSILFLMNANSSLLKRAPSPPCML